MNSDEPFLKKQIRLLLEQQAVALFNHLYDGEMRRFGFTVLAFDFNEDDVPVDERGNVAFKTNLRVQALYTTAAELAASFAGGPARFAPRGITPSKLRALASAAKQFLPAGVGYALIVGGPSASAYVSNAQRSGVLEMFQNELLPRWKEAAGANN